MGGAGGVGGGGEEFCIQATGAVLGRGRDKGTWFGGLGGEGMSYFAI